MLFIGTALAQDAVVAHDGASARANTVGQHGALAMNPIGWEGKLSFHAMSAYGPSALAGAAVYDGFLQAINFPRGWE